MSSYLAGKAEMKEWVKEHFPPESAILDVGACDGCWRNLLEGYTMDAVEAFEPNATTLTGYREVFCCDIADFEYEWYDLIIFGDVIEHMEVEKAQKVLECAKTRCKDMIVAVPYRLAQGAIYGNPWEVHIQADLTAEIFDERYKGFEPVYMIPNVYCYYHEVNEDGYKDDSEQA